MITTGELRGAGYSLYAGEMKSGHKAVALFRQGSGEAVEIIALDSWHVDQNDELQYANDYGKDHHWFVDQFRAGALSNQARELIADYVRGHEEIVQAIFDGDETAVLPQPEFFAAAEQEIPMVPHPCDH